MTSLQETPVEASKSQIEGASQQGSQQSSGSPQPVKDKVDSLDWNDLTVEIRDLKFTYQNKKGYLLKDVNMTLPKGGIYGLLGPSGCGKTTLIKLILGSLQPSSGTVRVNGRKTRDPLNKIPGIGVGFMPQEIALYGEFSIMETLQYFARIYGLKSENKKNRLKFLVKFFELPDPDRKVGVLSGGQKRRVSLAVAIIHNPPFLILDEPTVGIDPVLRERIWRHLEDLARDESTSILITTHYIEETRRAHVIALVRNGTILAEHSPYFLLRHFKTDNLEDVFLKACKFEENKSDYTMPKSFALGAKQTNKQTKPSNVRYNPDLNSSYWNKFVALTIKNFSRLLRNKLLLIVQLILPTISVMLMCFCVGKPPYDLDVAVYNQELENPTSPQLLSTAFLNEISTKTIKQINYKTNESAHQSVKDTKTYGAIMFRKGFTEALMAKAHKPLFAATDEEIFNSTIQFYGDLTNLMIFQTLFKVLMEANLNFTKKMVSMAAKDPNSTVNPKAADFIIDFVKPPIYGSLNPSFRDFTIPGIMVCLVYILSVALTSLSFVVERKEGLLERTVVAGVKIYEILISQIAVQLIVLFGQTFLLLVTVFMIFEIENNGNYGYMILLTVMQGVCGMSFGFFISSISSDEQSALMLSLGSFFPYLVLSGIMWPMEGMAFILRWLCLILPQTLPVIAMRNIMLKGWDITRTYVWLGYVATIGWTLFFLTATTITNSLRED